MGMNWILATVNGHTIVAHEGGTGGYSSFAAFDREAELAVVLLIPFSYQYDLAM